MTQLNCIQIPPLDIHNLDNLESIPIIANTDQDNTNNFDLMIMFAQKEQIENKTY